jgi:hypothetical protein
MHKLKIRTKKSKISVANFLSALFLDKIKKKEQNDSSEVATPGTLNAPVLSAVFDICQRSFGSAGSMMAT